MVKVSLPPPTRGVTPIVREVPSGISLIRLFDPTTKHRTTALSFRFKGPMYRFDHHRGDPATGGIADDPERGIYYVGARFDASLGLASCLVELFGDTGIVEFRNLHVGAPTLQRSLRLLDLRRNGAMRAGSVGALAACAHTLSQPWSRYFYDNAARYSAIDGIIYPNAHNGELALALYERAANALSCPDDQVIRLDHRDLRPTILAIMRDHGLIFE